MHTVKNITCCLINSNNIVRDMILIPYEKKENLEDYIKNELNLSGKWLECCQNTKYGIHFDENGFPSATQELAFRGNYPKINSYFYDERLDAFIPIKTNEDWILNELNFCWEPPIPRPSIESEVSWDGEKWVEIPPPFEPCVLKKFGKISLWCPISLPPDFDHLWEWDSENSLWIDVTPPQPYESWKFIDGEWVAPIMYPQNQDSPYEWNEIEKKWTKIEGKWIWNEEEKSFSLVE